MTETIDRRPGCIDILLLNIPEHLISDDRVSNLVTDIRRSFDRADDQYIQDLGTHEATHAFYVLQGGQNFRFGGPGIKYDPDAPLESNPFQVFEGITFPDPPKEPWSLTAIRNQYRYTIAPKVIHQLDPSKAGPIQIGKIEEWCSQDDRNAATLRADTISQGIMTASEWDWTANDVEREIQLDTRHSRDGSYPTFFQRLGPLRDQFCRVLRRQP